MLDFPTDPTIGQKYKPATGPVYNWDGIKWSSFIPEHASKVLASNTNPYMDGAAYIGSVSTYARGDHVHPTDTTRAPVNNASFTGTLTASMISVAGNVTVTGRLISTSNGHKFGWARGTNSAGAVTEADANIKFYDHRPNGSPGSWAGIGTDTNGEMWWRTGYSGNPAPVMRVQNDQYVTFRESAQVPTPGAGDNSTRVATTAYVMGRVPTGKFPTDCSQTLQGPLTLAGADLWVHNNGNYGVLYLGNTGARYLQWDGSNYNLNGTHVYAANGRLWGTNDYNPAGLYNNVRLAYIGDESVYPTSGLTEPYGGSVWTGSSGDGGYWVRRYRQMQYYTNGWFAIGYV